jgi:uncharacterized protein YdbL (DUF1318 family)
MKQSRRTFIAAMWSLTVTGGVARAADSTGDAVKARMTKRLPQVDALRAKGKAGENNLGFLKERQSLSSEERAVFKAENDDRRAVYALIAKRTGESLSAVGRKRAATLRKLAKAGVWLQDTKGKWYRKR